MGVWDLELQWPMKLVPAPFSSSLGREAKTLQENTTKVLVLGCVPQERMRELQKQKIPADASSLAELRKHKIPPNSFRIPSKILKNCHSSKISRKTRKKSCQTRSNASKVFNICYSYYIMTVQLGGVASSCHPSHTT